MAGRIDEDDEEELSHPMKRIPAKIHAYAPIEKTIARFLLRPDFVANLRDTSQDHERPEASEFTLMQDIHDAACWSKLEVGLKRVIDNQGNVRDVEATPGSRKKLVLCDIGLNITLNMDWYFSCSFSITGLLTGHFCPGLGLQTTARTRAEPYMQQLTISTDPTDTLLIVPPFSLQFRDPSSLVLSSKTTFLNQSKTD
jgi:hypothetical protein